MQHAPEFPSGLPWINTKSLLLEQLKGSIVVLDFWTYCCINCIHLISRLQQIEEQFKGKPVVVIGVHSAKFDNENNERNVRSAVERYGIHHPVVLDVNHEIWESYAVYAWPTVVVIDHEGYVRYKDSGETQYELPDVIEQLLKQVPKTSKYPFSLKSSLKQMSASTLSFPGKIDLHESLFVISDSNHNRILITTLKGTTATIKHIAGCSKPLLKNGDFAIAGFHHPQGVCIYDNKIYVADTGNHAVRCIDLATQKITTLCQGVQSPWDVVIVDDILYIAAAGTHQIYSYSLKDNVLELYAGTSSESIVDGPRKRACFAQPSGLATDGINLFIADSETSAIRKIVVATGTVSTIVGKGLFEFGHLDGSTDVALLQHCIGLCVDKSLIYVADTYNHAIRAIEKDTVSTVVKNAVSATCDIKTSCGILSLYEPNDVLAYNRGLLIADTNNHLIRFFKDGTLTDITIKPK